MVDNLPTKGDICILEYTYIVFFTSGLFSGNKGFALIPKRHLLEVIFKDFFYYSP